MHVIHLMVLPLKEKNSEAASVALNTLLSSSRLRTWYDWHAVGGRWDNYFENAYGISNLEDGNVLPMSHPKVSEILENVFKSQNREFNDARHKLLGTAVAESDVDGEVFGLPVASTEREAVAQTQRNRDAQEMWTNIISADGLAEAVDLDRRDRTYITWTTRRMLDLIEGTWIAESYFYDSHGHTANPMNTHSDLTSNENLENLALVAVDFHY